MAVRAEAITVAVVDDHPIFRAGLAQAVSMEGGLRVIGEGGSAAEAVRLVENLQPDVLLLDARMKDSGIERVGDILVACPSVKVIMLTASQDESDVSRALEAGVSAYVLKGATGPELRGIIRAVHAGEGYLAPGVIGAIWSAMKGDTSGTKAHPERPLSHQEAKVLRLLARGLNNKEIGTRLDVTERTVKFHLSNVFAKLQVRNRVEASTAARRMWSDL